MSNILAQSEALIIISIFVITNLAIINLLYIIRILIKATCIIEMLNFLNWFSIPITKLNLQVAYMSIHTTALEAEILFTYFRYQNTLQFK